MGSIASLTTAVLFIVAAAAPVAAGAGDEAKSMMADRCAVCHGDDGDGKGPSASSLSPPPKDFHNRKWQKSVTDETLTKAIVNGGPAVGLSAAMPGNPDLVDRPDLVAAMVKQIRAWGK